MNGFGWQAAAQVVLLSRFRRVVLFRYPKPDDGVVAFRRYGGVMTTGFAVFIHDEAYAVAKTWDTPGLFVSQQTVDFAKSRSIKRLHVLYKFGCGKVLQKEFKIGEFGVKYKSETFRTAHKAGYFIRHREWHNETATLPVR